MDKRLSFWLGLLLFSIYLLSFSGKFHVMDELAVFTAGHSLARHQRADIDPLIWTNHWTPNPPGIWGEDGHLYTKKAPGISFLVAPLVWLGHALPGLNAVHVGLLTNSLVTALTASLLFLWLIDLGFGRRTALLTTLAYGLGTIAWVYARMFWESTPLALAFLLAVWAAYRAVHRPVSSAGWPWLLLSGVAVALALTLRFEAIIATALIGLYLLWRHIRPANTSTSPHLQSPPPTPFHSSLLTHHSSLLLYLLPTLLTGLALIAFNLTRFGSLSETGYTRELLFRAPWVGSYGLLLSPGRGLFLYAPLMLLLFFGIRPLWRRLPRPYFWLISGLCLFYWLFYGSWFAWGGTWGWGPRFLLPILPLLMLFVAPPLAWAFGGADGSASSSEVFYQAHPGASSKDSNHKVHKVSRKARQEKNFVLSESSWRALWFNLFGFGSSGSRSTPGLELARAGILALAAASLVVNLLGLAVDFNEHFLRLGRNDDFVFNWSAFPPLGHWRILQEGLTDLIWLRPTAAGLAVDWTVLGPALVLLGIAGLGFGFQRAGSREHGAGSRFHRPPVPPMGGEKQQIPPSGGPGGPTSLTDSTTSPRRTGRLDFVLYSLVVGLAVGLVYLVMVATARVPLQELQAQRDQALLAALAEQSRPGDGLLAPMPPFGDVQEFTTRLLAYLQPPLPIWAWIESPPRAVEPAERARLLATAGSEARRLWLFERWLTQSDPTPPTTVWLDQHAFPLHTRWLERSGRLTLYALPDGNGAAVPTPLNVPFLGGLTLADFALVDAPPLPGDVLKLRLTWQLVPLEALAGQQLPVDAVIVSVQLLDEVGQQTIAQNDRLLLDLQQFEQSPLLPGESVPQGYGLQLPAELAPGAYPLVVSLYRASTGQRLPRADDSHDDFLYLTTLTLP